MTKAMLTDKGLSPLNSMDPFRNEVLQDLDQYINGIQPILAKARDYLVPGFNDLEQLKPFFHELCIMEINLSSWAKHQIGPWEPVEVRACSRYLDSLPIWDQEPFEICYDLYVSSVWNTYRKCHVVILDLALRCSKRIQELCPEHVDDKTDTYDNWEREAEEVAIGILRTIPFHLTRLNELHSGATNERKLVEDAGGQLGRPVGGLLLIHPLFVISKQVIVDEKIRAFARHTLRWIASNMGIGEGAVLGAVSEQMIDVWVLT